MRSCPYLTLSAKAPKPISKTAAGIASLDETRENLAFDAQDGASRFCQFPYFVDDATAGGRDLVEIYPPAIGDDDENGTRASADIDGNFAVATVRLGEIQSDGARDAFCCDVRGNGPAADLLQGAVLRAQCRGSAAITRAA